MKNIKLVALPLLVVLSSCGYRPRDDGRPQQIAQDGSGAALNLGQLMQVEGTRFFTLPIVRTDGRGKAVSGSGYYSGNDERNRLIVDSASGASRRVLPDENFSIVNWISPKTAADEAAGRARHEPSTTNAASGLYAAVVKRPATTDKGEAKYDVLLGRYEDGKQEWIARGLDGVQSIWMTPDGKLAMVGASRDRGIYRIYDAQTFRQLLESELQF